MIAVSEAVKAKINNGDIPFMRMQLITASGTTHWIENGYFWSDGISFSEATSDDSDFSVGAAVIGSFNFVLNNFNHTFDNIPLFGGAIVVPLIYYTVEGVRQYVPKGVFYVTTHKTSGNVIRCTAYDGMKLFDQSQTPITYPITVQDLVETLCTANGITLATQSIHNGSFVLDTPNTEDALTDRQVLSYACQVTGNFAKMNENGELVVGWYDFANPISVASTFDGKNLWTDQIEVTGVEAEYENADETQSTILYGSNDHVFHVSNNPFVNDNNVMTVCNNAFARMDGISFRPGSLPILANPCLQAGDVLQITDHIRGTQYLFPVTSVTYTKGITENISCAFEEQDNEDLRKPADYMMRASVQRAIQQATAADAMAQAASERAEKSGYQLVIVSDQGTTTIGSATITMTGMIYDRDMNVIDPDGDEYIYRWWVMQDGSEARYLNGGKTIRVYVDDVLCDYTANIYFETIPIEEGTIPFTLCNRAGDLLTNRAGDLLTTRAGG